MFIVIDGGTTNTRLNLVENKVIIDTVKLSIGARTGIDDNKLLKVSIRNGIKTLLDRNNLCEKDISKILASGMITSKYGLLELEHITAPAGLKELHNTMKEIVIKDVSTIPFVFVRGVKLGSLNYETADMMRGEETELMGIMGEEQEDCAYILPGSHSKIIIVDNKKKIVDFKTMLSGEMAAAISQNTILKDAVNLSTEDFCKEYLIKGYNYTEKNGINDALFKVRVIKNLFGASDIQCYSFYMGAVLHDEINAVSKLKQNKIIIGGRKQLRVIMYFLLREITEKNIILLDDMTVDNAVVNGIIKIYNGFAE